MSSQVPAAVKAADLARYAMRASQLEKAKPVISYYCNFWIVNQIIAKDLHNTDEECLSYTMNLMDKLEEFKSDNQDNDAVTDDVAAKAYVEQFGLDTLQRAENTVRANRATRQTADTFQAAATMLDLLQIWGEIEPEIAAKIKYAKYHALRIAKALKAGEDPNDSNPAVEADIAGDDGLPALDPNDAEVQMLNGAPSQARQPSVVDVPDEGDSNQTSATSQTPRPNVAVPQPRFGQLADEPQQPHEVSPVEPSTTAEDFYNQSTQHDVSPLGPDPPGPDRRPSPGGNYFPRVPPSETETEQQPGSEPLSLPSAPSELASPPQEPSLPPIRGPDISTPLTSLPQQPQSPPSTTPYPHAPTPQSHPQPPPQQHSQQPYPYPHPHPYPTPQSQPPPSQPHYSHPQPHQQPQPHPLPPPSTSAPPPRLVPRPQPPPPRTIPTPNPPPPPAPPTTNANVVIDDVAITAAQKHARWAVSALNFEDVPTAIREFRAALERLGG